MTRAATPALVLGALAGAVAAQALSTLPPQTVCLAAIAATALLAWRWPAVRLFVFAVLGFLWVAWRAGLALDARIPAELEGADIRVRATVVGLPSAGPRASRFDLLIRSAGDGSGLVPLHGRVRVGSYENIAVPAPGSEIDAVVRLRRPRGTQNPGGFDFERFALERGYVATGYVRAIEASEPAPAWSIDAWRGRISQRIAQLPERATTLGILRALAVGDQSAIPQPTWDTLRITGTAHLIAISGFHIGLVAGFGALLARLPYRLWPGLALRVPRRHAEAAFALATAAAYSLLAGMSLPVLRTLLMIAVVLAAALARRAVASAHSLALALGAVLLADPLALLGPGFWLSFAGVAWLVFCLGGRARAPIALQFGQAQVAMSVGLLPLCVWFFQQGSLVGPVANAVAVPVVSLVVVPLLLLGLALLPASTWLGMLLLKLLAALADALLSMLDWLAAQHWAAVAISQPAIWALVLALLGAAILLLPRGVPGRALGLALLLPMLLPRLDLPDTGAFDLTVLDVGQGLSVLVRTANHTLLYDTGPAPPGGLDSGEATVVPALTALGVRRLDTLVVSHGDNDHAGGESSVRRALRPVRVFASTGDVAGDACVAGHNWSHDGVRFEFLHPPPDFPDLGNQSSCVLRISARATAALLPGDIDALVETRLVAAEDSSLRSALVVAPHHGSRSSSSAAFVAATAPLAVAVSAAYRSRFGHPAADVVQRWRDAGAAISDTATGGALRWRLHADGSMQGPIAWRTVRRRYWHER